MNNPSTWSSAIGNIGTESLALNSRGERTTSIIPKSPRVLTDGAQQLQGPLGSRKPVRPRDDKQRSCDPLRQHHRRRSISPAAQCLIIQGNPCDTSKDFAPASTEPDPSSPKRTRELPEPPPKRQRSHLLQTQLSQLSAFGLFLKGLQMRFRGSAVLSNKATQLLHDTMELKECLAETNEAHVVSLDYGPEYCLVDPPIIHCIESTTDPIHCQQQNSVRCAARAEQMVQEH